MRALHELRNIPELHENHFKNWEPGGLLQNRETGNTSGRLIRVLRQHYSSVSEHDQTTSGQVNE